MYRWKPNATQKKSFAERMKDPEEKAAYKERKYAKTHYNPEDNRSFANKSFVPTLGQWEKSGEMLNKYDLTVEERDAAEQVLSGYSLQEQISHDYIHIVNHFDLNGRNS